jgi:CelD/BcsL family acetyltransferase involved in cellulose biosynthesis
MYVLNPLTDARWQEFVERDPRSSMFHSLPWLRTLEQTYGYQPSVLTDAAPGKPIENGLVFCRIDSWITGRRIVSLPFSDHCEPLPREGESTAALMTRCASELQEARSDYIEFRPRRFPDSQQHQEYLSSAYCYHELDLTPDLKTLFAGFHKDSIQRKIRRAEREGLVYKEGRSRQLLEDFDSLFLLTRRRHRIPPQPAAWFRNMVEAFGDALKIRVAYQGTVPTAAILTVQHHGTMFYKYGGSDPTLSQSGGTPMLLWETIQDAKRQGLKVLDFGRSDMDGTGLITFKDRWGTTRSDLLYLRQSLTMEKARAMGYGLGGWKKQVLDGLVPRLPDSLLRGLGALLYRHIG